MIWLCGRASCSVQVPEQVAPQSSETSWLRDRVRFEWKKATLIFFEDNLLIQWRKVGGDNYERKEGRKAVKG